jgi:hypothetical protein
MWGRDSNRSTVAYPGKMPDPMPLPVVVLSGLLSAIPDYGGPLQTAFNYLWDQYRAALGSTASDIAELVGEEQLLSRMAEDPRLRALLADALEAVGRSGFEAKRCLLGRAVAYAFMNGEDVVDAQVLMVQVLAELEPVHIRAMIRLERATADTGDRSKVDEFNTTQPRPVLAALERTGVVIPSSSWAGTGIGAHGLSDFGRMVLKELRGVAEEEMERLAPDS